MTTPPSASSAPEPSQTQAPADTKSPTSDSTASNPAKLPRTPAKLPRAQSILIGVLCLVLGFAIVAQVRQTQGDELSALSQEDLVRLLDEVTVLNEELDAEINDLQESLSGLLSGADAQRINEEYFRNQSVLAGTVPVDGPGVILTVTDPNGSLRAHHFVHVMEEMRNSAAEAIELSGVRLTANSYFIDTSDGIVLDGRLISSPYEWRAIGSANTMSGALSIHGGALTTLRAEGATVDLVERDLVQVTAIKDTPSPQYARPVE